MKKLLLSAIIAISAVFSANAQFWAGGSFSLNSYDKSVSVGIAPEVGYTFNGGPWSVGALLDLDFAEGRTGIGLSPYARYTFWKSGIASLFVDGIVGLNYTTYGKSRYDSADVYIEEAVVEISGDYYPVYGGTHFTFGLAARPGLAISLSDKLSVVTRLGGIDLNLTKYKGADGVDVGFDFGVNGGIGNLGLFYTF